eukprot:COSAG02_NODE_895_length_16129_cov_25.044604_10_plen_73_part_00
MYTVPVAVQVCMCTPSHNSTCRDHSGTVFYIGFLTTVPVVTTGSVYTAGKEEQGVRQRQSGNYSVLYLVSSS